MLKGTKWKCTDEDFEEFGKTCVVTEADENPDFNGDQDVEVVYEGKRFYYMKLRRFYSRHERVEK